MTAAFDTAHPTGRQREPLSLAPPTLPAASPESATTHASVWPWIGPRGGPRDKLCVRLSEALRERLDDTLADLGTRPDLLPGGASTLRSLNNLIAFACDALCTDLEAYRRQVLDHAALPGPTDGQHTGRHPDLLRRAPDAVSAAELRWPAVRPGSMYHSPWQDELATTRCQLTLRVPMALSSRLRVTLTWLRARPVSSLPPDLAGVGGLTDLVGLAGHRLCTSVETMPARRRGRRP